MLILPIVHAIIGWLNVIFLVFFYVSSSCKHFPPSSPLARASNQNYVHINSKLKQHKHQQKTILCLCMLYARKPCVCVRVCVCVCYSSRSYLILYVRY